MKSKNATDFIFDWAIVLNKLTTLFGQDFMVLSSLENKLLD
ncbi:MAG TPA: hypothetical protein VF540_07405 [Segetibacter sp.]|jgi:hypothetical protein